VRRLARALRGHGITGRLKAEDAGRVDPPSCVFGPDHETGYRNGPGIAESSQTALRRSYS
jgi:arginase